MRYILLLVLVLILPCPVAAWELGDLQERGDGTCARPIRGGGGQMVPVRCPHELSEGEAAILGELRALRAQEAEHAALDAERTRREEDDKVRRVFGVPTW